jgi:hypothetical protein
VRQSQRSGLCAAQHPQGAWLPPTMPEITVFYAFLHIKRIQDGDCFNRHRKPGFLAIY